MSGKSTVSKSRHPSRQGGWVSSIELGLYDWAAIENAIGNLTNEDKEAIQGLVDNIAVMAGNAMVSTTDIRATLGRISRTKDEDDLVRAFNNCDAYSKALIDAARYQIDGPDFWRIIPLPAKIRASAWIALEDLPKSPGGAKIKGWRRLLAKQVLTICDERGLGTSISHGETRSPAVALLMALLDVVDSKSPDCDSSAAKLLSEVRGK